MALAISAMAGASAWVSLGALAVTGERLTRLGALPPLWLLPVLAIAALVLAAVLRLRRAHVWPLLVPLIVWLPWIPGSIPAAWLIWEGPLEAVIWVMSLGGVLVSHEWNLQRFAASPRRAAIAVATLAFALFLVAAALLARTGHIPGGDEPHYLIVTQSLLTDHDLRIQNNHDRGDYFAYFQNGLPPDFLQRGRDGEIYSVHAPGVSALLLPVFAVAGYPAAVATIAAIAALGLALSGLAALRITGHAAAAWIGALAVLASATMFFHGFVIFPDPVGGTIVAVGLTLLFRLDMASARVTTAAIAASGALLGLLPWLHTRFVFVAAGFAVVLLPRLWGRADRWRSLTAFAAAPGVLAIAWFSYFQIIYGTPNPSAPYGNTQQNALSWIGTGLIGLLIDQQFGLVANAPVMVLVPIGLYGLWRRSRRLAIELVTIALPYVLVVASFGMWWAGWSAPARFLVCLLPMTVPLLACFWADRGRTGRAIFVAAVGLGAANIAARLLVLDGALLYNTRDGFDLLLDWLSRSVQVPLAFPSVHRSGPIVALLVSLGWAAVAAIGVAVLALAMRRLSSRGAQIALIATVGCVAVTAGVGLTWKFTGVGAVTPSTSQAEFLRRWMPDRRPTTVHLPSGRLVEAGSAPRELLLRSTVRRQSARAADTLLFLPWVPAGDYRLVVEGLPSLSGLVTVSVGMTSQTLEQWPLDGEHAGDTGRVLRLPSLVHSVTIQGDEEARRTITRAALRPLVTDGHPHTDDYVLRAARYGVASVFFADDGAFMEPGGIWTRADGTTRVIVSSPIAPAAQLDIQSGPVATSVQLRAGSWQTTLALQPNERRRTSLPLGEMVTIRTRGGFRPVDVDSNATDRRRLGVRLEFPAA